MTVDPSVVTLLREIPASNYVIRNYPLAMPISAPADWQNLRVGTRRWRATQRVVVVPGEKALLHEPDVLTLTLPRRKVTVLMRVSRSFFTACSRPGYRS